MYLYVKNMWEYQRLSFSNLTTEDVLEQINKCGKNNWEVIQYVEKNATSIRQSKDSYYMIFMKRKIELKKVL